MKRLLILLFFLPVLFACSKEELFEEGQEIVLNMSVNVGDLQSATTRAMDDNVSGTPTLWLVVFDSEGYLVEYTQAEIPDSQDNGDGVTSFTATLHATLEGRIMHFLLNYVDADDDLQFDYGHENNIIGGLTVNRDRDRDVYWQRVALPEGIRGDETVEKYLTEVPLVRNFSKITVTVNETKCPDFDLVGFYVLNVPKYGTVAPFMNGSFLSYEERIYDDLNSKGYHGTKPNDDERINKASLIVNSTSFDVSQLQTDPFYLYESTYIEGNNDIDKTVSVLLQGTYEGELYWYRVDLVKENKSTAILEYLDILRNFSYNIEITGVKEGKRSVQDAIIQPAGNNILSSLNIAHLTSISNNNGATLEVNYTDTVLISSDAVTVKYKFTDTGTGANTNVNIAEKTSNCGWYLSNGAEELIEVSIKGNDSKGWRDVTIRVKEEITERKEVSITFFAKSTAGTVLSRTVHYTLMPQQPMLVECNPVVVPATVGSPLIVNILIPDGLPEAMFPLDFAIEAQATGNASYLVQYITPDSSQVVTVQTGASIVDIVKLKGKKSFQYVVNLTQAGYDRLQIDDRELDNGQTMPMRILPTLFNTNTAQSASTVYAYNRYFTIGKDNFTNGGTDDFVVFFSEDNTVTYGVGRSVKLNIIASEAGDYTIESTTLQAPTRAISTTVTLAAGETKTIDLITSSFADRGQVKVTRGSKSKEVLASERNTLNVKARSITNGNGDLALTQVLNVYRTEPEAKSESNSFATSSVAKLKNGDSYAIPGLTEEKMNDLLYFSYVDGGYIYVASAKVADLSDGTAELSFTGTEVVADIKDLTLSGDKYYGEKRDVTFTFSTNRVGLYTITKKEVGVSDSVFVYEVTSKGVQTITLKTKTWSGKLSVTVSGVNASASVEGATRNTIKLGELTLTRSGRNVSDSQGLVISYNNGQKTVTVETTAKTLKTKGGDLILEGIPSLETELTIYYNDNNRRKTTVKLSDLLIKTTLTFS